MRQWVALFKIALLIVICLITIPLQFLTLIFLNNTRFFYIVPKIFYSSLCKLLNISAEIEGAIVTDRQVLFVGNHLSYLDIPLLGSFLSAIFIAKDDVKKWPILGLLATVGKTIFISRNSAKAAQTIKQLETSLNEGMSLIAFPEGTSSDGSNVFPFKSSLFDVLFKNKLNKDFVVQAFTTVLITANNKVVTTTMDRDAYAWYGNMNLSPHLWALAQGHGASLKIIFHPPRLLSEYQNRKQISADCYRDVSACLQENA